MKLPVASGRKVSRIHLVQPPIGGGAGDITAPLTLLALGAVLRDEGFEPHVVDLNLMVKSGRYDPARSLRSQFVRELPRRSSDIDLVGVTTWAYGFDVAMELVEEVRKKHRDVPIVLGGPHVTFLDEEVIRTFPAVDFVVRDEGDWTFPRLVRAIERGGRPDELAAIPGLTWRRGAEVVRNPSGGVVEDLDGLPYPAYDLVDLRPYVDLRSILLVEAGRGCPYNCNFCSTTNMFQRKYRVKSAPRLVDEIEWLIGVSGTNRLELLHDNLVAGRKYVLELCREIRRRNLDVAWSCTSRPDNMTEELAQAMFLAGCDQVFFGIESMSPERQRWTGKRCKPDLIERAVAVTARQHIRPNVGVIIGFPDESREEFDATIGAAARWTTDPAVEAEVSTALLRYYPGADLYARADELHPDPVAEADALAAPGYRIRPKWRPLTRLFPLQAMHTPPERTRRDFTRLHAIRTLLRACPHAFRASVDRLGLGPLELLERLTAGRRFSFLKTPYDFDLLWNEVIPAFGAVLEATAAPELDRDAALELLAWEVPFWRTRPVAPPLDELEHVVHRKRFEQEQLVAYSHGARSEPRRLPAGVSILAIRGGRECFVCTTREPDAVLTRFRRRVAALRERAGGLRPVQPRSAGLMPAGPDVMVARG